MMTRTCALSLISCLALGCQDDGSGEGGAETGDTQTGDGDGDTQTGDGDGDGDGDAQTGDGDGDTQTGDGDSGVQVEVSGNAFAFGPGGRIADATVSILELPEHSAITDDDGYFSFMLPAGAAATFVFDKAGAPRIHTKTFTLPDTGVVERVTFQVPDNATFAALASIVNLDPDPSTCQIASTITRVGKSLYDAGAHGEEGATVTIDPPLPAEHGPVYFNSSVIPQLDLVETSLDGGVLYTNVPPGMYTLHAEKPGVSFEDVVIQCAPDVLVNPSPPYGLQAL